MSLFLMDLIAKMEFVVLCIARYTIDPPYVILMAFRLKSERESSTLALAFGI